MSCWSILYLQYNDYKSKYFCNWIWSYPIYCDAGTYYLLDVFTQLLIQIILKQLRVVRRLYCPEGTDSALGVPCPEDNYRPSSSVKPIPTDVGYFASGEGNVQQEPCPQGTYSNIAEAPSCITCSVSFECTSGATVVPASWPVGTYKLLNEDLIFWQL